MIDFCLFKKKNPFPKILVAQNCIKKVSRNIFFWYLLKKVKPDFEVNSLEQYLSYIVSITKAVL